jgi:hypothetical protein
MSDVLEFKKPEPPAQPPKSMFGNDEPYLKFCAEWRAARAQQQKNWAEHEAATMWGTLPDAHIELDLEPLNRMKELEDTLGQIEPRTMLLARELLGVAITILAHEDRESYLAQGPLLDILRNVVQSLEYCKAEMRIGKKAVQS